MWDNQNNVIEYCKNDVFEKKKIHNIIEIKKIKQVVLKVINLSKILFFFGIKKIKLIPIRGKTEIIINGLTNKSLKNIFIYNNSKLVILIFLNNKVSLDWIEQPILRLSSYNRKIINFSLLKTIHDNFLSYSLFLNNKLILSL